MLEVLREDYIRTAKAKGLSPARVVFVHGLRNALIPVLTVVGLQVGPLRLGFLSLPISHSFLSPPPRSLVSGLSSWRPYLLWLCGSRVWCGLCPVGFRCC